MTRTTTPSLRFERTLMRERGLTHLACCDEVGRGALSGPVTIGTVVISLDTRSAPQGVKDSKLLTPQARERLAPRVRRWALDSAVGHASAAEIDEFGVVAALRLAGHRSLAQLGVDPDAVLLDGNHDYLTPPEQEGLFGPSGLLDEVPPVVTLIKGDLRCAAVAAASILAKTERDRLMVSLDAEHPGYGWGENKGYSAPAHLEALARVGPCVQHRRSWRLPGIGVPVPEEFMEAVLDADATSSEVGLVSGA
ncbi:ribonuclease HII [Nocardioides insulae]|uniref:ribonuclease HII n=1 Tax=Nocardioides insulae TaxID=394734 RepID=UPI00041609DF|nr:ribonuclease HII [Nocardioides insulae]